MLTQCPLVCAPVVVTNAVVLPDRVPTLGPAAPPPITGAFSVSAAVDAIVVGALKYGIPPDVPFAVTASVPAATSGELLTVNTAGMVRPTEVTPPLEVPQAEPLSTKLPLASMLTQCVLVSAPADVAKAVVLPERVPDVGAPPAPPPRTGVLSVNAPDDTIVVALLK